MENYYTEASKNLEFENQEYKWMLDNNKEPTDTPVDKNNHLKDGGRYAITTHRQMKRKKKVTVAQPHVQQEEKRNPLDWL